MKSIKLMLASCCLVLFLSVNTFAQRLYVQNNTGCHYEISVIVNDACDGARTINPVYIAPNVTTITVY